MERHVNVAWTVLKWTFGLVPIVAGLDKFAGLLTNWEEYLGPLARSLIPMAPATFMKVVGIVEIVAGVLVLWRPRVGAWVVCAWLVAIALQLLTTGKFFDVAVRDLVMAIAAFGLAELSIARERVTAPARREVPAGAAAVRA
jgi:uncharacterized membrane protein YphA (DoxX/SURF4 family)